MAPKRQVKVTNTGTKAKNLPKVVPKVPKGMVNKQKPSSRRGAKSVKSTLTKRNTKSETEALPPDGAVIRASLRRTVPTVPYQAPGSQTLSAHSQNSRSGQAQKVSRKRTTTTNSTDVKIPSPKAKKPRQGTKANRIEASKASKQSKKRKDEHGTSNVPSSAKVKKRKGSDGHKDPNLGTKKSQKQVRTACKTEESSDGPKKRRFKCTLTPRPAITCYERDPTFESNTRIPDISTVADSHLVTRAIILRDNKLLTSLLKSKNIGSTGMPTSIACSDLDPLHYALKSQNFDGLKILLRFQNDSKTSSAPFPQVLLQQEVTGRGSRYMFGHALRQVAVGRGGKEGNAALLKDCGNYGYTIPCETYTHSITQRALELGLSFADLKRLESIVPNCIQQALSNVQYAVRSGHRALAADLIEEAIRLNGFGFNHLHAAVLTSLTPPALTSFKSVSVAKKSLYNCRLTPLHCAAINPNPEVLKTLLAVKPDPMILDGNQWSLLHYAAVCDTSDKDKSPLKYLLTATELSTMAATKDSGDTPLHLACKLNRVANVQVIVDHELEQLAKSPMAAEAGNEEEENEEDARLQMRLSKRNRGKGFMQALNKTGLTPLHVAAHEGHLQVLQVLLEVPNVDINKANPAQYERVTPLMVASARGHLNIVKYLIENRERRRLKIEQRDKRGRTALIHAVMNGNAHVVSYLLRVGVNHLVADTSGNSCTHYAAAYGWFFVLQLLLEAGCPPNAENLWKMTPMAIAFMKGHMGLVQVLLQDKNVDVNARIDDSGKTLLLHACSGQGSKSYLDRIKFLINEGKADTAVTDYKKNNCLHTIVETAAGRKCLSNYVAEEQPWVSRAVETLITNKCSLHALNEDNFSPISLAVKHGCWYLLRQKLLPASGSKDVINPIGSDGNTILHLLAQKAHTAEAMPTINEMSRIEGQIAAFRAMAAIRNKAGLTPLLEFLTYLISHGREHLCNSTERTPEFHRSASSDSSCSSRRSSSRSRPSSRTPSPSLDTSNTQNHLITTATKSANLQCALKFLLYLLKDLSSDVNSVTEDKDSKFSVLHLAVRLKDTNVFLQEILKKKPVFDTPDGLGRSPLALAIELDNFPAAQLLIESGASVQINCGITSESKGKPLLLYLCTNGPSKACFELIPMAIEHGADPLITDPQKGQTLLHFMARTPKEVKALAYARALVQHKVNPAARDKCGRTALHIAVSQRSGETDSLYDLEDFLVDTCPQSLGIVDSEGRTPLHYAFSQGQDFGASSFMDPIELVNFLVRSMKQNGLRPRISTTDKWGRTALHYAACRGSTISCSLLCAEMPQAIDTKDLDGNTAFGLSVLHKHEASSLQFQQLGADFLMKINSNMRCGKVTEETEPSDVKWALESETRLAVQTDRARKDGAVCTILEQVVKNDWQGILYLMLEKLENSGQSGVVPGILAALRTVKLVLAKKLLKRVKNNADLVLESGEETLVHVLAKWIYKNPSIPSHLVEEVFGELVKKQVPVTALDSVKASALIFAAVSGNSTLVSLLHKVGTKETSSDNWKQILLTPDKFGRTPLLALFWRPGGLSPIIKEWAPQFWSLGCNVNDVCEYPISLNDYPGGRYLKLADVQTDVPGERGRFPPLISAVIQGDYNLVKWLLSNKKYVDVNARDCRGRTAIMHAVRLNDIKMVKLLLNPTAYSPSEDNVPWQKTSYFVASHSLDLTLCDNDGNTVLHHMLKPSSVIGYTYANVEAVIRVLQLSKSFSRLPVDAILQLARKTSNIQLVQGLQNVQKVPKSKQVKGTEILNSALDFKEISTSKAKIDTDLEHDSQMMRNKLRDKIREEQEQNPGSNQPPVDRLLGPDHEDYEVVVDHLGLPLDCVLTKVDLTYGLYGLYNFYKIQLVKQVKGKDLIILFTQWGRVGDEGQYQRTPFATMEEGVKNFADVFKSKTGNDWSVMKNEAEGIEPGFTPVQKKYRLVHKELRCRREEAGVQVDFSTIRTVAKRLPSNLSPEVFKLMEKIALDCHEGGLSKANNMFAVNQLPFGLLDSRALARGEAILEEIKEIQATKDKLPYAKDAAMKDEEQRLVELLVEKSSEFYATVPLFGFESTRLEPMFYEHELKKHENTLANIKHIEIATRFQLAAQLHCELQDGVQPLDYMLSALGANLEVMQPTEEESQIILTYIMNTAERKPRVRNLFRVERDSERGRVHGEGVGNRWLLWHGTQDVNLLSILHRGLQPAPIGAQLNGHLFGKGIYFADMFQKSSNYCRSQGSCRYMLLCDVALGNVHSVELRNAVEDSKKAQLPNGFHSALTADSRYEPDPGMTICWKGRNVPLGKRTERILPENRYYGLDYNEYIVFNPAQVRIKYLVQFD